MKHAQLIGNAVVSISLVVCSAAISSIVTVNIVHNQPRSQIALLHRNAAKEATITLEGITNQQLTGSMYGNVRVFLGDQLIAHTGSGEFSVPAGPLLTHKVQITVPEGMQYVASKRGKKFYPVLSASARSITPLNRVYFTTADQAIAAGYTK